MRKRFRSPRQSSESRFKSEPTCATHRWESALLSSTRWTVADRLALIEKAASPVLLQFSRSSARIRISRRNSCADLVSFYVEALNNLQKRRQPSASSNVFHLRRTPVQGVFGKPLKQSAQKVRHTIRNHRRSLFGFLQGEVRYCYLGLMCSIKPSTFRRRIEAS
jgi:hypothetical protein